MLYDRTLGGTLNKVDFSQIYFHFFDGDNYINCIPFICICNCGYKADDSIQEQGQGQKGWGDDVRVGEEAVGRRLGQEFLDEDKEGCNTCKEAHTSQDDIQGGKIECHCFTHTLTTTKV